MTFIYHFLSLVFFLSPASTVPASDDILAIVHGSVVDVGKRTILENGTILIRGDRIVEVGPDGKVDVPEGATLIDARGKWIIPGLVDAHIHLFQSGGLYTRPDAIDLRKYRPYQEEQWWVRENAGDQLRRYLACGITTVVDVGGPLANYALRDSLNGSAETATVYLTGPLVSTYQPDAFRIDDAPIIEVKNEEEARELVRKQLPYRPDFIKIWYIARNAQMAKDNLGIIQATIEEAHGNGLRVAVHATQLETARLAVKAGADLLVHSVDDQLVDDDFIQALKTHNTVYTPTLVVSRNYGRTYSQDLHFSEADLALSNPFALGTLMDLRHLPEPALVERYRSTAAQRESRYQRQDSIMALNLRRLWDAGIVIATGTDAGNIGTLHATSYYDELAAMQRAGLDTWQILQASTLNGAKAIGKAAEFGNIAPGRRADLVILDQDPLASIDHWKHPHLVVHRGQVIRPAEIVPVNPEILAQQQLNAYNARDIEAFLAPYGDEVELYNFPNTLIMKGKDQMRQRYGAMFQDLPDLHCELVNRIIRGNTVIDHERVTLRQGDPLMEAVAIYTVENGKIVKVHFVR